MSHISYSAKIIGTAFIKDAMFSDIEDSMKRKLKGFDLIADQSPDLTSKKVFNGLLTPGLMQTIKGRNIFPIQMLEFGYEVKHIVYYETKNKWIKTKFHLPVMICTTHGDGFS
jgi:hypothetical protein